MSEFEFTAQIATSFTNPTLDDQEIVLIAEYDYFPAERGALVDGLRESPDIEEEIDITAIKPKGDELLDLLIAGKIWDSDNFSHLIDDIFASRNDR